MKIRPIAAGVILLGAMLSWCGAGQAKEASLRDTIRQRLEEDSVRRRLEQDQANKEPILDRLREKGFIALHDRTEEYPRKEDYSGWSIRYEPIDKALPDAPPPPRAEVAPVPNTTGLDELVRHYAQHYGVEENLVWAVIHAESRFNPNAVSPAGARGLMQLMPGTAAEMGVADIFDPAQNIAGGTQYLARMLALHDGDVRLALAAYNAGPGNVRKYGGIPPFEETQQYVKRVLRYRAEYAGKPPSPTLVAAAAPEPTALPATSGAHYTLRLSIGLTQPAEVVVDSGDYYLIRYQNREGRIRKGMVEAIAEEG